MEQRERKVVRRAEGCGVKACSSMLMFTGMDLRRPRGGGANGALGSESNFHPWIGLHAEYSEC